MTNRQAIRAARRQQLAALILKALAMGRAELPLIEILPQFSGKARFARLSSLHVFVDHQHVTAPHPGQGGHRPRTIKINSLAKRYADGIVKDQFKPTESIPDGTPIGDEIFSMGTTRYAE